MSEGEERSQLHTKYCRALSVVGHLQLGGKKKQASNCSRAPKDSKVPQSPNQFFLLVCRGLWISAEDEVYAEFRKMNEFAED